MILHTPHLYYGHSAKFYTHSHDTTCGSGRTANGSVEADWCFGWGVYFKPWQHQQRMLTWCARL